MLDDGAIGRGDPSVRHHFRDSVSDTMRITDLAAPRKIPPGTGWRKFVYSVSFHKINPGESPRERHYRNLQGRIRRHIRRQYVITVVSGKGGVGVTTMAACIGGVFRECRPENVIAIDAVPSFGTLADRIDESPPGDYAAIINDTDVQGYADIREHLGQNTVGLDVLAGNRTSDQPRPLVPAMFSAVLSRLRRTHTVIVIDTSPDLEHSARSPGAQYRYRVRRRSGHRCAGNGNRGSATEGALTSKLTGFSPRSARRVAGVWTVFVLASAGWALGGQLGAVMAVVVGVALVFVQWWGQPAWSWAVLGLRGRRPVKWNDPITLANNRSGGGVRVQDGVAVVAVQLLGRAHRATTVTGSVTVESDNVIDVVELAPLLRHPLDLELDSISVVTFGSRTGTVGDYPRVYDAEIGTPPYAGRRETWLIMRLPVIGNTQALRWRTSVGAAAISVAQRVASSLRCQGLRAKLATATDLAELDRRLGSDAVAGSAQRWKAIRGEAGWMTTYAYPAEAISSRVLSQAWTLRADEVIQNVTVYPDATCTATITVRTPTPAPTPPSVILRRLNGEQAAAAAANMCGPRPHLRGQRRCPLPAQLVTEIGPSGVLIGKLSNGDRLMIPVTDAGELSRVFVAADDTIAKRIVIRVVGAGERVCVHTRDQERWASVRMPQLSIVGTPRPAPRTTVGVVEYVRRRKNGDDGKSEGSGVDVAISPTPRPASVITIARPGTSLSESDRHGFEVTIEQIDRATVKVGAAGQNWLVEMEMFRAENRYVSLEPVTMSIGR